MDPNSGDLGFQHQPSKPGQTIRPSGESSSPPETEVAPTHSAHLNHPDVHLGAETDSTPPLPPPGAPAPRPVATGLHQSTVMPQAAPLDTGKPKRRGPLRILLLVVVIAAGAAAYLLWLKPLLQTHTNSKSQPQPAISTSPTAPTKLADAHTALGFNVLNSLGVKSQNDNVFISPTSISLALSMVYNGAAGQTKQAMATTLQTQKLSLDQVNQGSQSLVSSLAQQKDVTLSIANSAWVKQGFSIKPTFTDSAAKNYNAKITNLDFANPTAPTTINQWVSANTNGKIPGIVNEIPESAVLYLINATYFKGAWTQSFDPTQTQPRSFTDASGVKSNKPTMQQQGQYQYLQADGFQSVSLPYGGSQRFSMNIFLPDSLTSFAKQLNYQNWNRWMGQYQKMQGTVLLPKFTLSYQKSLNDTLKQLGMGVAFSGGADFSNLADGVAISDVEHSTYLDVNEQGTEAAGVTSVGVVSTSANGPEEKTFTLNVNKPFFIAIRDNQTGEVLFTGLIRNP